MKQREINLIDLVFVVLLKWRMIIVAMLVGAVLLTGFSYWQSAKSIRVQQDLSAVIDEEKEGSQEEILLKFEEKLTEVQKNNVQVALNYEEYNEYYNEYYDNSFLMQIDANSVPTMELIFSVETQNEKDKSVLVSVYAQIIENGIVQWLAENGMDVKEAAKVAELVTVNSGAENQAEALLLGTKGVITVLVIHIDEERCRELAESVEGFVFSKEEELESVYGAIEIRLIDELYATQMNQDVLSKQRTIFSNVYTGNTGINNLKKAFTEDEAKYYELLKGGEVESEKEISTEKTETTPVSVVTPVPSVNVKLVIIGMLAFAFLYVSFVLIMYFFNNTLRVSDNLFELYAIPMIGIITKTNYKKKFLSFVDTWIMKLRDRNKRKFTKDEAEEIAAVAIKMAVRKLGANEVSMVGCEVKKQTEDICNNIKTLLEKEDITVTILDNVLYNAETLEKLSNVTNVVLIEKTGSTMYDEVEKELEVLKRYGITIVGAVLVD